MIELGKYEILRAPMSDSCPKTRPTRPNLYLRLVAKRAKILLFKALTLVVAIGFGLLLAECGIRWYWYGSDGFSYVQLNSFKTLGWSGLLQRSDNDTILWELEPKLDTVFKLAPFSTNSFGMRDREYPKQKPANTIRVAIIGDSFAMGSGVNDEENYPAVLETLLADGVNGQSVEVLNFGVGGYNLWNYEAVLSERAMAFDPDVVVIGFCGGNDFRGPQKEHLEGKLRLRKPLEQFWRSHLWKLYRMTKNPRKKRTKLPEINERQKTYMHERFANIGARCDAAAIPAVVCYYSLIAQETDTEAIRSVVEPHGLGFFNAGESLMGKPVTDLMVHKLDAHPSAAVHRVYAETLRNYLLDNGLLH